MTIADGTPAARDGASAAEGRDHDDCIGRGSRETKDSHFPDANRPLHRLATVRKQQGISQRNVARHLGVETATVCQLEHEATDLPLSLIYAWQKVLDVPAAELLVDSNAPFSPSVLHRARLIRVMKTTASIREKVHTKSLKSLVATFAEDLLEIMPELREVAGWNTVGRRRALDELGQVVERQLPDDFFKRRTR
jgi:transcriptional regulator with XRE-family HTH domain